MRNLTTHRWSPTFEDFRSEMTRLMDGILDNDDEKRYFSPRANFSETEKGYEPQCSWLMHGRKSRGQAPKECLDERRQLVNGTIHRWAFQYALADFLVSCNVATFADTHERVGRW